MDGDVQRVGRAVRTRFAGTAFELSVALGGEARRLQALMRDGGFDVAHYHAIWTPFLPMQAFMAAAGASVATVHDTPPDTSVGAIARKVLPHVSRAVLPLFDRVITVSAAPRACLRAGPGQGISIIPPCTDLRRFAAATGRPRAEDEPVSLLFLGRLEPRKGCSLLLEAYRRLCAEGLNVRLVIVGAGAEEAALRQTVEQHGLPQVVFEGRAPDEAAPQYYADCDIFCAPAPYGESFGIVIAEAMAAGRPVVAAANPGYSTLLKGEAAQGLARAGDAEAFYRALRRLVVDPARRRSLGAWGRAAATQYDCRTLAPRLVGLYREAILAHEVRGRQRRPLGGLVVQSDEAMPL